MSTMKNLLRSFLSRLALCALAAPLILLSPALVWADTIRTFDVSGTARNDSGKTLDSCLAFAICDFSGMFRVDTTTGTVESSGADITLPGLPVFFHLDHSEPIGPMTWAIVLSSHLDAVSLEFPTAPTPGSLKGFAGGPVTGGHTLGATYHILGGSITPVPEPSSLILFASGLLVLGLARRFGKKVAHPSA